MSGSNIQEIVSECKGGIIQKAGDYGIPLIVMLVAVISFGLGRLSASESLRAPVSVSVAPADATAAPLALGGEVEASETGTVYYFPWCGSVNNITPQKLLWFKSEGEAQKAGYRAAKNCKGLGGS
jgi:hypothetical protein